MTLIISLIGLTAIAVVLLFFTALYILVFSQVPDRSESVAKLQALSDIASEETLLLQYDSYFRNDEYDDYE